MSNDIVSKAAEFINRRRQQLGGSDMTTDAASSNANDADNDIPILTDVFDGISSSGLPTSKNPGAALTTSLITSREDIARELAAWLDENLPHVVLTALDGITDQLITDIQENAFAHLLPRLQDALDDPTEPD